MNKATKYLREQRWLSNFLLIALVQCHNVNRALTFRLRLPHAFALVGVAAKRGRGQRL